MDSTGRRLLGVINVIGLFNAISKVLFYRRLNHYFDDSFVMAALLSSDPPLSTPLLRRHRDFDRFFDYSFDQATREALARNPAAEVPA